MRLLFSVIIFTLTCPSILAAKEVAQPHVVLDAGHGGTNRGAFGPKIRRYEKELTLVLAKSVAVRLRSAGIKVSLTRKRDRYLTLAQRVRIANQSGAQLFVSIHLNASESRSLHGFETFVASRHATDAEARRLARRENRKGGQAPVSSVAGILGDLGQRANHLHALRFAKAIQKELRRARPKAKDRGVRQAPFDVLMGLKMPGVLIETGFIDHPVEGPKLADHQRQERIADAISTAIRSTLARRTPRKQRRAVSRR